MNVNTSDGEFSEIEGAYDNEENLFAGIQFCTYNLEFLQLVWISHELVLS
jgi:hypothetical protein